MSPSSSFKAYSSAAAGQSRVALPALSDFGDITWDSHFDDSGNDLTAENSWFISAYIEMKDGPLFSSDAVAALAALAQENRLALFRLLVQAGADGMPAGAIAETLGIPNSSLSFHLAQLRNAGLIQQERRHRSLIYRADYAAMNALVGYLMENCCAGAACSPEAQCEPQERKSA